MTFCFSDLSLLGLRLKPFFACCFRPTPHDADAPFFLKKPPVEITVKEGDALTLTAMVDGDPKPAGRNTQTADLSNQKLFAC